MKMFLLSAILLAASSLTAELTVQENGGFRFGKLAFSIKCFNDRWQALAPGSKDFAVTRREGTALEATLNTPALQGNYRQQFTEGGCYEGEFRFAGGTKPRQVALSASLPVETFAGVELEIDGRPFELPVAMREKDPYTLFMKKVGKVTIPGPDGRLTVSGDFVLLLHDNRTSGWTTFELRLVWPQTEKECHVKLDFQEAPYTLTPLDLRGAFTTGFTDDRPDDREGGWTDQGSGNDLRQLPTGKIQTFERIPFDIAAGNKSCIVLRGPFRDYFPQTAAAELRQPAQGKWLYLLHATAWSGPEKTGDIELEYSDGSRSRLAVSGGSDVGNWHNPQPLANGKVVWTGENRSAIVGLYQSAFPIEDKPVRKLTFTSTGKSVWAIIGATLASERLPEKKIGGPVYIEEGENWKSIRNEKDVLPGSVLDFSGVLDAPAGKYGPVVAWNGRLEFRDRPGVPVRFYGTNLVDTAQYQTHEWSEKLTERMAASGFNLVRIHHHDNGLSNRTPGKSTELDPVNLERLNYLIHCLKQKGIYVITDCYCSRVITPEELPALKDGGFKHLIFLDQAAMENWKSFTRNWFTAVNPYTGLALKDDPVLVAVNLINEGNIGTSWNGTAKELHLRTFEKYKAGNPGVRMADYLADLYRKGFAEMRSFLRDELGMKTLISDQNHRSELLSSIFRDAYDYVDNHYYFDHPRYPEQAWRLPARIDNVSTLSRECSDLAWMFPTRIWNKPFTITEFDYAKPNFYRAEGAVLTGAYAGLQDWDALVQFAYSHGGFNITADQAVANPFDLTTDVVKALSHRIGVKLFLGNEIKPAPVAFALTVTGGEGMDFSQVPSRDLRNLGLVARIGLAVLPDGKRDPARLPAKLDAFLDAGINFPRAAAGTTPVIRTAGHDADPFADLQKRKILSPESVDAARKVFRSEGGQLALDTARETFRAAAPGIEVLILPAKQSASGTLLAVDNRISRGVFSLQAVDGKPLKESRRMLFLHLTDSQASLLKFDNALMQQHSTWGKAPHLAARGEAAVRLALPAGKYQLYSCDTAGKRLAEVPLVTGEKGAITFQAKVFRPEGQVFVYELIRN